MKKITIKNAQLVNGIDLGKDFLTNLEIEGPEEMETSDGHHTIKELYEHRIVLFIALCRLIEQKNDSLHPAQGYNVNAIWRSKLHADGSSYDGWFIMGIKYPNPITYHLPMRFWEETNFAETLEKAPEWDGHTSDDVLKRLKQL